MVRKSSKTFAPRLDILPSAQRRLWDELGETPSDFVLYGRTAVALRLGHRQSEDFDFFSSRRFAPTRLKKVIRYLSGAEITQSSANTLTCIVDRGGPVQVSFFGGLELNRVADPDRNARNKPWVASLLDMLAVKLGVLRERAQFKDYCDIDAMLKAGMSLQEGLAAARAVHGSDFNPFIAVKALMTYSEGDLHRLDADVRIRLTKAAEQANPRKLRMIVPRKGLVKI